MSNDTQSTGPVSMQVDRMLVDKIVKDTLETEILKALGGQDQLIRRFVNEFLQTRVSSDGRVSSYSSENKYCLMDIMVQQSIQVAVREMLTNVLADRKKQFEQQIAAALSKQTKPFAEALVKGLSAAIALDKINVTVIHRE